MNESKDETETPAVQEVRQIPYIQPAPVVETSQPAPAPIKVEDTEKVSKIKKAFLYILVGGLGLSALISISAILVGEFNSVVAKALFTTLIFVSHSLIVLGIVLADRNNKIGKSLLPTVVLGAVIANMITTSFGTWEIWDSVYTWRAFQLYILFIGAAFLITSVRRLSIAHKATKVSTGIALASIISLTVLVTVWILDPNSFITTEPLFYRLIGALAILGFSALSAATIFYKVALAQTPELILTVPEQDDEATGLHNILHVIGVIVTIFWVIGAFAIVASAFTAESRKDYIERYPSEYDYERIN